MFKRIQFLVLLSFFISTHDTQILAREQQSEKKAAVNKPELYQGFFPYQTCLQVTVDQVEKKPNQILLLKATVEAPYLGKYSKNEPLVVSFYEDQYGPNTFDFLSSLRKTRQIMAFNHYTRRSDSARELLKVSKNPIRNLWLPFGEKRLDVNDIAEINNLIKSSPIESSQRKTAFQKLLEAKWTPDRINDFCRPETRRTEGEAVEHSATSERDWHITAMHQDKTVELQGKRVEWQAAVDDNIPISYNILVVSQKNLMTWDLEYGSPSLKKWSDDDFLIHRIGYSLNQAAWAYWVINHGKAPAPREFRHLILGRSREVIVKDKTGNRTAYKCLLSDGTALTAELTDNKSPSIEKILINGTLDPDWTEMYKNNLSNLAKCNKQ